MARQSRLYEEHGKTGVGAWFETKNGDAVVTWKKQILGTRKWNGKGSATILNTFFKIIIAPIWRVIVPVLYYKYASN